MSVQRAPAAEILHDVHGCLYMFVLFLYPPPQKKKDIAEIDFTHLCVFVSICRQVEQTEYEGRETPWDPKVFPSH